MYLSPAPTSHDALHSVHQALRCMICVLPCNSSFAAKWPHDKVAAYLVDYKCDVNMRNKRQRTPLHTAALFQRRGVLEILLRAGADVNVQDDQGDTPLRESVQLWHEQPAQMLSWHMSMQTYKACSVRQHIHVACAASPACKTSYCVPVTDLCTTRNSNIACLYPHHVAPQTWLCATMGVWSLRLGACCCAASPSCTWSTTRGSRRCPRCRTQSRPCSTR